MPFTCIGPGKHWHCSCPDPNSSRKIQSLKRYSFRRRRCQRCCYYLTLLSRQQGRWRIKRRGRDFLGKSGLKDGWWLLQTQLTFDSLRLWLRVPMRFTAETHRHEANAGSRIHYLDDVCLWVVLVGRGSQVVWHHKYVHLRLGHGPLLLLEHVASSSTWHWTSRQFNRFHKPELPLYLPRNDCIFDWFSVDE